MAKASWCSVSPMSGSENGTLTISAAAHAGRDARSTTVTVTTTNGDRPSASIVVSQAGVGIRLTMDATKPDVPAAGGTVVINGTSNSRTLEITALAFANPIMAPGTLRINSNSPITLSPVNGTQIVTVPGDPGANGTYAFIITIVYPRSPFPIKQPAPVGVKASDGSEVRCDMYWLPGQAAISVSQSSLSLVNGGNGQTVNVASNDDWSVS